jgi:electron transfer flavoprotein alpha subunit
MSVLVYTEHSNGSFRKSSYEALSYGYQVASELENMPLVAVCFGDIADSEINNLGKYGPAKIIHVKNEAVEQFSSTRHSAVFTEIVQSENAKVIIIPGTFTGKGFAPRVAARLKAGYVDGVVSLPDTSSGFIVRKNAFSGKAFAEVNILSDVKVLAIVPNSYKLIENQATPETGNYTPSGDMPSTSEVVKETVKASDKISLPEAELVVSGGRGLKGPENWGMIEELAEALGAATACSKPVSDADWRPHSEHVGQTGISISPNLYIAIGISGAIQHLAGVSASKTIVVINKDPEAPFFKAADYGIVGDAFEVVPKLIESVKKYKSVSG